MKSEQRIKMRSMKIGMMQINGSFSGQSYMPYSAITLQANTRIFSKNHACFDFMVPVFKRGEISEIVRRFLHIDVLAISLYVWNEQISLEVARRLKAQRGSEIVIIVGGPQVPESSKHFLERNDFIDFAVHGEGEKPFSYLLDALYESSKIDELPSLSFIREGQYTKTRPVERERELDHFVSPYLSGAFDELLAENPNEDWTALWETNRGCPFQCTFCDWGSATAAKVNKFGMERLYKEVDWFVKNRIKFVYCCDANYGILPRDKEIAEYIAWNKEKHGYPQIFSVQSTKNSTRKSFETQKIISDAKLSKGVSLSMQSLSPVVLKKIKRDNIHQDTYDQLQIQFSRENIETYSDIIIGLPGETFESFAEGVQYLISQRQYNRIRFNNLTVLPNAEVGDPTYQELHGIETRRIRVVHVYGEQDHYADDVPEFQELVVGTSTAKSGDWVKIRAFAYLIDFIFYDKTAQIPLLMMQEFSNVKVADVAKAILGREEISPVLGRLRDFFIAKAAAIQQGDVEYCYSEKFLKTYWKADEFMLLDLVERGEMRQYFDEMCEEIFHHLNEAAMLGTNLTDLKAQIREGFDLTELLFKMPGERSGMTTRLNYSIYQWYDSIRRGSSGQIKNGRHTISLSPSTAYNEIEWARQVVWYGNRTGAYFYGDDELNFSYEEVLA